MEQKKKNDNIAGLKVLIDELESWPADRYNGDRTFTSFDGNTCKACVIGVHLLIKGRYPSDYYQRRAPWQSVVEELHMDKNLVKHIYFQARYWPTKTRALRELRSLLSNSEMGVEPCWAPAF